MSAWVRRENEWRRTVSSWVWSAETTQRRCCGQYDAIANTEKNTESWTFSMEPRGRWRNIGRKRDCQFLSHSLYCRIQSKSTMYGCLPLYLHLPLRTRQTLVKAALPETVIKAYSECFRKFYRRLSRVRVGSWTACSDIGGCFYFHMLMNFRIDWQVTQPESDGHRFRLKGRISGSEFNKILQASCGFVYARTRKKNVSRWAIDQATMFLIAPVPVSCAEFWLLIHGEGQRVHATLCVADTRIG
jgi:hypothetical protein